MNWTECKNRHWPLGEGFTVAREETLRVLVQSEHVKRRPQHEGAVPCEGAHFSHGLNIYLNPTFAQRGCGCLGNFLR
jgi:hypothetical protein